MKRIVKNISFVLLNILIVFMVFTNTCTDKLTDPPPDDNDTTSVDTTGNDDIDTCTNFVDEPPLSEQIFPMQVGNYWKYEIVNYFNWIDTSVLSITNSKHIVINNDTSNIYVYQWNSDSPGSPSIGWFGKNLTCGFYEFGGETIYDTLRSRGLLLKYPVNAGDEWFVLHHEYSDSRKRFLVEDTLKYKCIATNEMVETPAGQFECVVYFHSLKIQDDVVEKWDYYEYYSPGIGRVLLEARGEFDQSLKHRSVLIGLSTIK